MLRRLVLNETWRSLDQDFWGDALPLGRRTLIYGHNGSGKSTLSELLLSLSKGNAATDLIWEDETKHQTAIQSRSATPFPSLAVFTRRWVEANLSAFLDGQSADAIVTLGKEAIDAKDKETHLIQEINRLQGESRQEPNSTKLRPTR